MTSRKYFKVVDDFFSQLENEDKAHFFKGKSLNPLKVIAISQSFPAYNAKNDELLLLYSKDAKKEVLSILVTSKHIYYEKEVLPLALFKASDVALDAQFIEKHLFSFKMLIKELQLLAKDQQKDLEYFTNKFKEYLNEKESVDQNFDIDHDFLKILKNEGEKITELVEDLNNDKAFSNAVNSIISSSEEAIVFKAEHVVLNDIIKVFNVIYPLNAKENTVAENRLKFTLAFLFEKLQGQDLISSLSIERINNFVKRENFDKNIKVIQEANFFNLGDAYENEFLLPSVLKRLNSSHFSNASAFLYRVASLMAKSDGTISDSEKEQLTKIQEKLKHPKQELVGVSQTEVDENETLENVLDELEELIGLENVKQAISELSNFLKVQKLREERGLKSVTNTLHAVFMGSPGTGKTTIARLISKIYKHLGYLEKGHLVETDRTGMVAGYVGQTALKVQEVLKTAMNGVLFIDEAYSLANGNERDFGNEAVEVLLKSMEDHRDSLVVIVAGYPDEMETFIESNPGLQSRFTRYFTFEHYKPWELIAIFQLFCKKNDFVLAEEAQEKLLFIFEKLYEKRHKSFGNARVARNLFEKIIEYQANRIVSITPITEELLKTITEADIPPVNKTVEDYLRFQQDEKEEA